MIGGQTRSSPESGKELIVGSSPIPFTYKDLQLFTDDFSEENLICAAHFGKVYRGKIPQGWDAGEGQHVTVKIWEDIVKTDPLRFVAVPSDCATRFRDELDFLLRPDVDSHPNLVRLKGYCCEDNHLCSVYDLKSSDTLHNFVAKGTLKWLDVIKIALGVARALDFLHSHAPPYLIRDLSSAYVMLDEDFNPVLFEFAMLTGGATGDKPPWLVWYFLGSHGYCDWWFTVTGQWTTCTDVFAFGVILLELLFKRPPVSGKKPYFSFTMTLEHFTPPRSQDLSCVPSKQSVRLLTQVFPKIQALMLMTILTSQSWQGSVWTKKSHAALV